jgi:hypothetical protein
VDGIINVVDLYILYRHSNIKLPAQLRDAVGDVGIVLGLDSSHVVDSDCGHLEDDLLVGHALVE